MRAIARAIAASLLLSLLVPSVPAHAATDLLPDLAMARLRNFSVQTVNGQRQLRFTTIIVNIGAGPFQVTGSRSSTNDTEMNTVTQQIFDDAGGHRDVATPATMFFAGDGHNHWHVRDLETYTLARLDNGTNVGTGEKHGFCFFDNVKYRLSLPEAPQNPVYGGCGGPDDLQVTAGLSVGWGDSYAARLPDQFIDITGLQSGDYRLTATADASNWFVESKNGNNRACVDLRITNSSFTILGRGCH